MADFKKLTSIILIFLIFIFQGTLYAYNLRNPLGTGNRFIKTTNLLASNDKSLMVREGLEDLRKQDIDLIYVLAKGNFLDTTFTSSQYLETYNKLVDKYPDILKKKIKNKRKKPLEDSLITRCRKGILTMEQLNKNKNFKATNYTKQLLTLFETPEEFFLFFEHKGPTSVINYINLLKLCYAAGKGVVFKTGDLAGLYTKLPTPTSISINVVRDFLVTATYERYLRSLEWGNYEIMRNTMQNVIKRDFPIKGTFKIEQVERRLKESKITFGIAPLHIESDQLGEDTYSIYDLYHDPLQDIIGTREVRPQAQKRRQDRSTIERRILEGISSKIDELYIKPDAERRDYGWIIFCKWLVDNINIKDNEKGYNT